MSILNIGGAIISLLTPLKTAKKIKQLDQFSSDEVVGYPRIQVLYIGADTEYLTNRERLIKYKYNIIITQEKSKENIGNVKAEDISNRLIQEVIELFDGQINSGTPLSSTVDYIEPVIETRIDTVDELAIIRSELQLIAVKTV